MSTTLRPERVTQNRVVERITRPVAQGGLGYAYLGDWSQRDGNRCVELDLLHASLQKRGYSAAHISQALTKLQAATDVTGITLYQANLRTYQLLRYGVQVQVAAGAAHETVHLIDWGNPQANDFGLAQEVTLRGGHERRPDVVLYINGMAVVVLELKRGSVEVADGIRQLNTNQEPIFNQSFFSTVQLTLAGNDSQGLRYGTAGTPEKFYVEWKHHTLGMPGAASDLAAGSLLDEPLAQMCEPTRLLDLMRNFVVFDAGQKKVPRLHQYEGIKAAQLRIKMREGGVIWHTQGSGKSILMVLLAKWILENEPDARVLIVTDRDELDKQITGVMKNAGVISADAPSPRITSRRELVDMLSQPAPRLMCALIHKFDAADLKGDPPPVKGRFYVFVDECHRTQGGDMNKQMKRWLSSAVFIGFTGTPLLRKDKQTTRDVFGTYIHTYKFHQAVEDKVVLDLKYEARTVPQQLTNKKAVDDWFETKTRGLNNYKKSELRRHWATMESLMSAGERKGRIVADIIHDFGVKPRLDNNRGTAILVAASIYDACHYLRLFRNTSFGDYCGIITSYQPNHNAISREPPKSDERYKFDTYTQHVLAKDQTTKQYEDEMKRRFIEEPANLKLLIVVSKLLTGFDAPSCTYIYLDNELRDHNLFQAICRTNRLDGEDKDYGHIVDYKELFQNVQNAIAVYTSDELDIDDADGDDGNVIVKDWLKEGKAKLDAAREALSYLCAPVSSPKEIEQFIHYFCGHASDPEALTNTEPLRITFYKSVSTFVRAYADLAQNLAEAGYSPADVQALQKEADFYVEVREAIKMHSGEEFDIKPYEADMRHLINTYIQADSAHVLGDLETLSLTDLIIKTGIHDAIAQKLNAKGKASRDSIAEGIINNVRKTIIRDRLTDPRFYDQMSKLLDDLIKQKRDDTEAYESFLRNAEVLVKKLVQGHPDAGVPMALKGNREATTLYNNLINVVAPEVEVHAIAEAKTAYGDERLQLALKLDKAIKAEAPAGWKGDEVKERVVQNLIHKALGKSREATLAVFELVKNQPGY
ncbi:type I restriction endonuclease subunit R [Limnohabitans sp. B9-3]|uniref:type I restriction endonuclease subunit R n=1 Tax=Limnohabitans sp. B9-3 TaxID=1100707 RepID=UPI000C1EF952|nr:type I restriction endonuclease subunit R [Limnohabitans sp. B9-3]PIT75277.1 restriction endonuclease subunit R [Limnohabitans sp. B9-3]